jgi:tetratricopeptide (TPR) repeat protein
VARADRRRSERAGVHDRGFERRYESAYLGTEGLFFQRLRKQAKWMFVFLALVFGVGFVAFGVGGEVQGGIADVIGVGGGGGDGLVSEDEARERLKEKPNDPQALRDLSTALQRDGKPEEAIQPLETYTTLRSKDEEALLELAGLHLSRASRINGELQTAQVQAALLDPSSSFLPPATSPLGQALAGPPITAAVTEEVNAEINTLFTELQGAYAEAQQSYEQVARLSPNDPNVQIQLADAALNAGDSEAALAAYKKFLKLAPDDPNAELVRDQIKQLEAAAATTPAPQGDG